MAYQVKETKEDPGILTLFENDIMQHCPFKVPLVMQSQVSGGKGQIIYHPCRSDCALFFTEVFKMITPPLHKMGISLRCSQKGYFMADISRDETPIKPLIKK